MRRPLLHAFAISAALLSLASGPLHAQRMSDLAVGLRRPAMRGDSRMRAPAPPSAVRMTAVAIGLATASAVGAGALGGIVDNSICERRHRGDTGFLFGPCFFYAGAPTAIGWLGGGIVGATVGAARTARQRGCGATASWSRALGGAVLGAVPGTLAAVVGGDRFPPRRSALIFTAPLLTGAGAAVAVVGCHDARRGSA